MTARLWPGIFCPALSALSCLLDFICTAGFISNNAKTQFSRLASGHRRVAGHAKVSGFVQARERLVETFDWISDIATAADKRGR